MLTKKDREKIKTVEELICSYLGVSSDSLHTDTKEQDTVDLRQTISYITREFHPLISCASVGEYFNKNHSTISQGIAKLKDSMQFDKAFRSHIEELKSVVQASLFNNNKDFDKLKRLLIREVVKAEKVSDLIPVMSIIIN